MEVKKGDLIYGVELGVRWGEIWSKGTPNKDLEYLEVREKCWADKKKAFWSVFKSSWALKSKEYIQIDVVEPKRLTLLPKSDLSQHNAFFGVGLRLYPAAYFTMNKN